MKPCNSAQSGVKVMLQPFTENFNNFKIQATRYMLNCRDVVFQKQEVATCNKVALDILGGKGNAANGKT